MSCNVCLSVRPSVQSDTPGAQRLRGRGVGHRFGEGAAATEGHTEPLLSPVSAFFCQQQVLGGDPPKLRAVFIPWDHNVSAGDPKGTVGYRGAHKKTQTFLDGADEGKTKAATSLGSGR